MFVRRSGVKEGVASFGIWVFEGLRVQALEHMFVNLLDGLTSFSLRNTLNILQLRGSGYNLHKLQLISRFSFNFLSYLKLKSVPYENAVVECICVHLQSVVIQV